MAPRIVTLPRPSDAHLANVIAAYILSQKLPLPSTRDELKSIFSELRVHPVWLALGVKGAPSYAVYLLSTGGFIFLKGPRKIHWQKLSKQRKAELVGLCDFSLKPEEAEGEFSLRRELRALGYSARTGHSDIDISWPFPADTVQKRPHTVDLEATATAHIDILNRGKKPVLLTRVFIPLERPTGAFKLTGCVPTQQFCIKIEPGKRARLTLTVCPRMLGLHQAAIIFAFNGFELVRSVHILVEDAIARASAPETPFVKPVKKPSFQAAKIVEGEAPPMPKTKYEKRLPPFLIPASVRSEVENGAELKDLKEPLRPDNYVGKMARLLYVEELQMEEDIQLFNMEGADLEVSGSNYLALKVPGLAEKRPSVLYGDRVYVHLPGQTKKEFEGYVHSVELEGVLLKFHPSFHRTFVRGQKVNVRFTFNRVTLRREHEAISESAKLPRGLLFPAPTNPELDLTSAKPTPFKAINKLLNEQQLGAAREVLNRSGGGVANSWPYLVFGPPGTGKTNTCIEAMLQVLKKVPGSRILACAPSNFAADVILERLVEHVEKRYLYRLNAPSRSSAEVEQRLMDYCTFSPSLGHFTIPSESDLSRYRVIVSTCCSASLLHAQGLARGHFSHVFIDEAGHARETEAIIPVGLFANELSVVVLAGDHKQLGPIVRSRLARQNGLERSYLERLATQPPYLPQGPTSDYHPRFITRLVCNYRSHPAILALPSKMFYNNQLIPCADEAMRSSLTHWEELPNKKDFPILFHGVEGKDERERNSPSWFNPTEVSQVVHFVSELIGMRGRARVQASDIGIISPYRKQVQKIDKQLKARYPGVKVGSVEQFQGREKRIIIISTVRSSVEHIESDLRHNLGFLRNPKRFNVAITRAKALLIVIGNPHVLAQDRCWGELYEYCVRNGAYTGCDGPKPPPSTPDQSAEDALLAEWSRLNLSGGELDDGMNVEKPEWPEAK